jgi:hypothetical protein
VVTITGTGSIAGSSAPVAGAAGRQPSADSQLQLMLEYELGEQCWVKLSFTAEKSLVPKEMMPSSPPSPKVNENTLPAPAATDWPFTLEIRLLHPLA